MTPLQQIYDAFLGKIDENMFGKEAQIFQWLNSARAKCKKYVIHSLDYVLDSPVLPETVSYDGNFLVNLDDDEIDLIAMQMKYEYYDKKNAYLIGLKREIGTKDFNSLPNKKQELDGICNVMKIIKEDIKELQQQFNTYKYN